VKSGGCRALVLSMLVFPAIGVTAHAQDAETTKMLAEITSLSNEQKQIPDKVKQSLALKQQNERQFKALEGEGAGLKAESAAIEAQRPSVHGLCTGTVPHAQFAAAQARCRAVQDPFNRRVDAYNARKNQIAAKYQVVNQRESARAAAAKQLIARNDEITKRIALRQASIRARQVVAKPQSCTEQCKGMTPNDAAAQCLQSCVDGARAPASLPTVEQKQRPPFVATPNTPNRTPQQAIDEYKKSGSADPTPKSFRKDATEPPPPSAR
jgi:hypothetical protein